MKLYFVLYLCEHMETRNTVEALSPDFIEEMETSGGGGGDCSRCGMLIKMHFLFSRLFKMILFPI